MLIKAIILIELRRLVLQSLDALLIINQLLDSINPLLTLLLTAGLQIDGTLATLDREGTVLDSRILRFSWR